MQWRVFRFWCVAAWLAFACGSAAFAQDLEPTPSFVDDFSQGLNTNIWRIKHQPGRHSTDSGGDKQFYVPEAISTDSEGLLITARQQRVTDPMFDHVFDYTSGEISTREAFLYGRFEVVARPAAGDGLLSAIWLYTWQARKAEIDIIEALGRYPTMVQSTLHVWRSDGKRLRQYCVRIGEPRGDCADVTAMAGGAFDFTQDYHTYTLEWLPDKVIWYLDGKRYHTQTIEVPDVPMNLTFNLALGSDFAGAITPQTSLPASMHIKSVRVWRYGRNE